MIKVTVDLYDDAFQVVGPDDEVLVEDFGVFTPEELGSRWQGPNLLVEVYDMRGSESALNTRKVHRYYK